ncbi:MAG: peptide-methionine (S)-S-oxide reductase MsrA [Bacteroidetes bacterium]|nr:peptide-methionine (S)-S-oxide reductase MsrA [Bacteroidota bacterium]MDA0985342.1 peptide-methionine (S)-S-oxide reductase MsrA [Bacteroidota bacterium]
MKTLLVFLFTASLQACISSTPPIDRTEPIWEPQANNQEGLKKAYFASGCFWCVEAIYESVQGVSEVYSGYAGGFTKNPNYNQIGTGRTGHAEAVEVLYDPNVVSFGTLVQVFFGSHDPTTPNRQGPDYGSQYRSIAFYTSDEEREIIQNYLKLLEEKKIFSKEIVTEIKPLEKFYYAEAYHQDYEKNNPDNPYVRQVSIPRLKKFQSQYPELLKNEH